MNALKPPALATWLLNRLAPVEKRDSLIGDLIEQHQRGRSSAWYWRQAVSVIVAHLSATIWRYKWVAVGAISLNAILPYVYRSFIAHWVVVVDMAWYLPLMQWFIETQGITIFRAAYGLTTGLTVQIAWCVLIFSVTWIFVRYNPKRAERSSRCLFSSRSDAAFRACGIRWQAGGTIHRT